MNRGSPRRRVAQCAGPPRFNEAPIHESGKSSHPSRRGQEAHRFNEAPIHESGKFRDGLPGCGRARRFNEAPIHESGK